MQGSERFKVGFWFLEERVHKLNFNSFIDYARSRKIDVFPVDLTNRINQPMDGFIHKLNDLVLKADHGDQSAKNQLENVETFLSENSTLMVFDPLESTKLLLNRVKMYELIKRIEDPAVPEIFVPALASVGHDDVDGLKEIMRHSRLEFPIVCKPVLAESHEMALILNEDGLDAMKPPCIIQNFINHDAILYKLFVFGDQFHVVTRPSIRNIEETVDPTSRTTTDGQSPSVIYFTTAEVSKEESSSALVNLCRVRKVKKSGDPAIDYELAKSIVESIRREMNLDLFGADVIVETATGRHAVIDVNVMPVNFLNSTRRSRRSFIGFLGYRGMDDFNGALYEFLWKKLRSNRSTSRNGLLVTTATPLSTSSVGRTSRRRPTPVDKTEKTGWRWSSSSSSPIGSLELDKRMASPSDSGLSSGVSD